MLRSLVAALLLANLLWWGWHWPPLAQALGLPTQSEREPQRLARQVQAERVQLLGPTAPPADPPAPQAVPAEAASAAASTASAPPTSAAAPAAAPVVAAAAASAASSAASPSCLEIGPLDDSGVAQARLRLLQAGVAPDAWVDIRREKPGQFAIYMGRFTDMTQLQRKADELSHLGIAYDVLGSGAPAGQAPGLMLGRFSEQDLARQRLQQLQARGVRTAHLLTLVPAGAEHRLRLDRATEAQQARLLSASAGASAPGSTWRRCSAP